MNAQELRALQAPLKQRYKDRPETALLVLKAEAALGPDGVTCQVKTFAGPVAAGLHPATGGDGSSACSANMLLEALVGCAGVTLRAVANTMEIPIRGGTITAECDLDFRGTLGLSRDVPVGMSAIRLNFTLDTDASEEQIEKLLQLTKRYCVVYQTLKSPPTISTVHAQSVPG